MATSATATNRQSRLSIQLGGEQIMLERVEAVEALSTPFAITVDFISELSEIDLLPHLGKPACVSVTQDDAELERFFHGYVAEGEFMAERTEGFQYRLLLRPFTHFMSFNRNFEIHYKKTAIDIIKLLLERAGVGSAIRVDAAGSGLTREYCTQYGESDFTFISRLMEEEGIYYYWSHAEDKHVMVLCDKPGDHKPGKAPTLEYNTATASVLHTDNTGGEEGKRYVQRWHERVSTGNETKVTLRDFDFEKSARPLQTVVTAQAVVPPFPSEVYDWPAPLIHTNLGKRVADSIIEGRRAEDRLFTGETQLPSLEVGTKFTLTAHPHARFNREVLITRTHHVLVTETYRSGSGGEDQSVVFEAIPSDVKWRAPLVTPRPVVRGPETAIVIGPTNETIHTDKWGRIQVRFHWDRSGEAVEKMTCWLRVSQTGGLGNLVLPRVGHEVIVDFLDGDPDRPVAVGRVFNDLNKPIYPLPDQKTRAVWRSKTYTSAGGADSVGAAKALDTGNPSANEIRMEDAVGKEELFFHAQRDLATRVRRSETHHVGLDQASDIHGARTVTIDMNDTLDVKKTIKVDAGIDIVMEAKSSITLKVGQNSMVIDQKGITIKGLIVTVQGTTKLDAKSPMTTVKGDAMLTLNGGVVFIN